MEKCKRCDYEWEPKVEGRKPKSCPRCKSYTWDEERPEATLIPGEGDVRT